MENFWDYSVWGSINLVAVLLASMLVANMIKRSVPFLKVSLIPTSVLGGSLLLIIAVIYKAITNEFMFDAPFFGGNGSKTLEVITYHSLALGFIATAFKPNKEKLTKKRNIEIFDTGVTTVATYLIQGILGMSISLLAVYFVKDFFPAAGILLPFGYGQGTGQALNWGGIYEMDYNFVGGKSFGLTIAAFGFLSASIGGVIHLNILKKKNVIAIDSEEGTSALDTGDVQGDDEIPMNGSMDKVSVQMAFVFSAYIIAYLIIYVLGNLVPSLKSILYGFNFLFGVLIAVLFNSVVAALRRKKLINRQYINTFLMNRISGFFFDIMIVAGIAAIRIDVLENYWVIIIIMGLTGAFLTYYYVYFVCKKLFKDYPEQQFLAMYGMLTGTASTGMILLREVDKEFKSPVSENLVYQNLPAIVFGFPMMLIAALAPKEPMLTFLILIGFFIVMNLILFRSFIFKKKN